MEPHKGLATFGQYEDREETGGKADETRQGGVGRGSMGNTAGFEHDSWPNAMYLAHP